MVTDYAINKGSLDLNIINGDFAVIESTEQHQRLLLIATPGEYKQKPLSGVGLSNYLLDERPGNLLNNIRSQFTTDGMSVETVTISEEGILTIKADYE